MKNRIEPFWYAFSQRSEIIPKLSHIIGFDDGPFDPAQQSGVLLVGAVFSKLRLEGVLSGQVQRDGDDATRVLIDLVSRSKFAAQVQVLMLQGIAVAGFNVVDLHGLHAALGLPVIAVARRQPDLPAVRRALLENVAGGQQKWSLIERLGPMEPVAGVFVQRVGISLPETSALVRYTAVHSKLPEPLRTAHLIAGGMVHGESRHRA